MAADGGIGFNVRQEKMDMSEISDTDVPLGGDVYHMNHGKRGKLIIINNRKFAPSTGVGERHGTDKDENDLSSVFEKLGFEVSIHRDLTSHLMLQTMLRAGKDDHSNCDCFVVAVLTHGDSDVLYGTDDFIIVDNFVEPIKRCPTLFGKPKIFIIQACRGNETDSGIAADDRRDSNRHGLMLPVEADILLAYSSVLDYVSWRNTDGGSWFIQALVQVLSDQEKIQNLDFVRLLTCVNHIVAHKIEIHTDKGILKQMPTFLSTLTKDLYLKPKQRNQ